MSFAPVDFPVAAPPSQVIFSILLLISNFTPKLFFMIFKKDGLDVKTVSKLLIDI